MSVIASAYARTPGAVQMQSAKPRGRRFDRATRVGRFVRSTPIERRLYAEYEENQQHEGDEIGKQRPRRQIVKLADAGVDLTGRPPAGLTGDGAAIRGHRSAHHTPDKTAEGE